MKSDKQLYFYIFFLINLRYIIPKVASIIKKNTISVCVVSPVLGDLTVLLGVVTEAGVSTLVVGASVVGASVVGVSAVASSFFVSV